ncbi:hypothetical protein HPMG_01204 [Helicobacter pullorum MIT 98-5489]|uniref:Uncharacterized protein n=1 Tax=Helicobacter pullorum MIT 98-5489 TaxID=537972 RepID=C5F0F3_9HELI|nr:hypothetical protein HPMG_01204 [Helicobacter pullorum MIT 98-5489]
MVLEISLQINLILKKNLYNSFSQKNINVKIEVNDTAKFFNQSC